MSDAASEWSADEGNESTTNPEIPVAPVSTIDDVVARMESLRTTLAHSDGVWWFNELYLAVTKAVRTAVAASDFASSTFLSRLDVVFASRYFAALDAAATQGVPSAWRPLFDARDREDLAPIQFALAGMNAHINYDLVVALVDTCVELGIELTMGGPEHEDFLRVNPVLQEVQGNVETEFEGRILQAVERVAPRIDTVTHWSVVAARNHAWDCAQVLWALRDRPTAKDLFLESLGGMVKLAGRGLLIV